MREKRCVSKQDNAVIFTGSPSCLGSECLCVFVVQYFYMVYYVTALVFNHVCSDTTNLSTDLVTSNYGQMCP